MLNERTLEIIEETGKIRTQDQQKYEEVKQMTIEEIIQNAEEIKIISGEGEIGTVEEYEGKRTLRALKMRLTKERCNGDRWAKVKIDGREYDI